MESNLLVRLAIPLPAIPPIPSGYLSIAIVKVFDRSDNNIEDETINKIPPIR